MPEVQTPEGTHAAPTYRLDVELHELLMKPPEQPRLLPPPPDGKLQTLPEPVFPQHPELMSAPDEDYFPVPVGAASGAQAVSPSALQSEEGRQARVYSKALVEENGKPS